MHNDGEAMRNKALSAGRPGERSEGLERMVMYDLASNIKTPLFSCVARMPANSVFNASAILAGMKGPYSILSSIAWPETFIVIRCDQITIETASFGTSFSFSLLHLIAQLYPLDR